MKKIIFLILCGPIFFIGAETVELNDQVKRVIYQYAEIVDSRNFDQLDSIMWEEFSITGGYDLKGIDGFMGAMDYLVNSYSKTMHFIGNIDGNWEGEIFKGKTYCIASHIFEDGGEVKKLDMGIIYNDTLERRDGVIKFLNRDFNLQWQKTETIDRLK